MIEPSDHGSEPSTRLSARVVRSGGQAATLVVAGALDCGTKHVLQALLPDLIRTGVIHVLVEAAELNFCDLSGARLLEDLHARLHAFGGAVTVAPSPPVARMLELIWPRHERAFPNLIRPLSTAGSPPPIRHLPTLRAIGGRRRRTPANTSPIASGRPPVDIAGAIERATRLRHRARLLAESAREQIRRSYQVLAALHDTLATTHHVQASPPRPCAIAHTAAAAAMRAQAARYLP
ncbi:STAS domain-containing protein [Nonomuraea endophytica]|uniref:Anti-anti-sigma regulatory factor n=1 Tax=Nonomuraea endophytica TaxID=714136 RepID=A0A7W8AGN1_9ACTN|nr:STAS domain-containing protein [Nonomuraea endophytica]MBB5085309.1 anti-anti-sigma regulatory factor [Nonomuraea endophytica]